MVDSQAESTTCEATIETLSTDGRGIARIGGHAVFVAGGLPGDRLRLRTDFETRPASAEIVERISLSPLRVAHPCPHADRCVGSPWGSLIYEEQLRHKRELLARTLHKMLGEISVEPVVPSPELWHYRNRVSLRIWRSGDAIEIGFRTSPRQIDGVAVSTCSLAESSVGVGIHSLCRRLSECTPDDLPILPVRIQLHRTERGAGVLLIFAGNCESKLVESWSALFPREVLPGGSWFTSGTRAGIVHHHSPVLASPGVLLMRTMSLGHEVDVHPVAFCQANTKAAALVERDLQSWASQHEFHRVWDLYGGFGALGLAAAGSSLPAEVFEMSPYSEPTLRKLAARAGNRDIRFHRGDLLHTLARHSHRISEGDLILLDPPRSGAHEDVLRMIGESSAKTVAYLSCNPARLARDLAILRSYRFQPQRIRPYDFFPHTPTVEVLTSLFR